LCRLLVSTTDRCRCNNGVDGADYINIVLSVWKNNYANEKVSLEKKTKIPRRDDCGSFYMDYPSRGSSVRRANAIF